MEHTLLAMGRKKSRTERNIGVIAYKDRMTLKEILTPPRIQPLRKKQRTREQQLQPLRHASRNNEEKGKNWRLRQRRRRRPQNRGRGRGIIAI